MAVVNPSPDGSRNLLVVAYFFPPLGGGGVQRTVKFLKYLRPLGWRAEVVTVRAARSWVVDPTLAAEVPADTVVHRTAALTPGPLGVGRDGARGVRSAAAIRWLRRLSSLVLVPDAYAGWFPFALARARERLEAGGIDAVLTTSSPDTAHLVGLVLRERFQIPWIADFRDPWMRRLTFQAPTAAHHKLHHWLEGRVLERADRIVVTNEATRDDFLARHPKIPAARLAVIPNGFDPEDLAPLNQQLRPPRNADELVLTHTGLLSGKRTLAPIAAAMSRIFAEHPELRQRLTLRQIGPREDVNDDIVARAGIGDRVVFLPPTTHAAILEEMTQAGALLLLEAAGPEGQLITPGKIFEYLASRGPILAAVPEGPAAELVRTLGAGEVVPPEDTASIAAVLARWIAEGPPTSRADEAALAPYARPALAARLAGLLDELVPAAPVAQPPPR